MNKELRSKHIHILGPRSKTKWNLYVDMDKDGEIESIHTGWYGGQNNTPHYNTHIWDNKTHSLVDAPKPTWEPVQPFVFEGGLIPGGSYRGRSAAGMSFEIVGMKDSDTGWRQGVVMHIGGVEQALKDICAGTREIHGGAIYGVWSFKKGGANVFVEPFNRGI